MTEIQQLKKELSEIKLGPCDLNVEGMSAEKFNFYANVNLRFSSLITTIESQKSEIEGYKAITELAVKGLKQIRRTSDSTPVKTYQRMEDIAQATLDEIERIQNAQT